MKFDLSRQGPLTVARLEGAPEEGDFHLLFDALAADAAWQPGQPLLVDKTQYDTSGLTVADVYDIARVGTDRADVVGSSRIAIVVARDLEFGMNRMFMAFVKWAARTDVFRDRAQAEAWLDEGESATRRAG